MVAFVVVSSTAPVLLALPCPNPRSTPSPPLLSNPSISNPAFPLRLHKRPHHRLISFPVPTVFLNSRHKSPRYPRPFLAAAAHYPSHAVTRTLPALLAFASACFASNRTVKATASCLALASLSGEQIAPASDLEDEWQRESTAPGSLSPAKPYAAQAGEAPKWGSVLVTNNTVGDTLGASASHVTAAAPTHSVGTTSANVTEGLLVGAVNGTASSAGGEFGGELRPAASDVEDEWGEPPAPQPEPEPSIGGGSPPSSGPPYGDSGGSSSPPPPSSGGASLEELKRCLVDTVYGTDLGLRASSEVRAEVVELVSQLEAANPTTAPSKAPQLLDGNWILIYTAFSELLPLLAVGTIPLLKVDKITQEIDTSNKTIVNRATLSSPAASFSFSASASFEVRSPSRIQVEFKEGSFQPPQVSNTLNLPEQVDILGQKISLRPVEQVLTPLQEAFASIARSISGLPPLKVPIPGGNRAQSWLLTTFLDDDFRISRGDGGLFILAKEGSPLLDQLI